MGKKYVGYALTTIDKNFYSKGKTRQAKVYPYEILLNSSSYHNKFVLLHELAHCLAPHVERKYQGDWVYL